MTKHHYKDQIGVCLSHLFPNINATHIGRILRVVHRGSTRDAASVDLCFSR